MIYYNKPITNSCLSSNQDRCVTIVVIHLNKIHLFVFASIIGIILSNTFIAILVLIVSFILVWISVLCMVIQKNINPKSSSCKELVSYSRVALINLAGRPYNWTTCSCWPDSMVLVVYNHNLFSSQYHRNNLLHLILPFHL